MSTRSLRDRLPYLVLGLAFLATAAYVLTVLPGRSAQPVAAPPPSPVAHSDGLSDSHDGYLMRPVTLPERRGKAVPVAFQILGRDGMPLTEYETVQERQLHLYLIRDDASGYQHLHPALADGTWRTAIDIGDGGAYRLYAEFTPKGWTQDHPVILGVSFVITGDTKLAPLPAPAATATAGRYTVHRLDGVAHLKADQGTLLRFQVPGATLEPHLGAAAHLSAFEVLTGALIHLHAATDQLTFHAVFPQRGEYRLFIEFKADGEVHRAAFTVFAT